MSQIVLYRIKSIIIENKRFFDMQPSIITDSYIKRIAENVTVSQCNNLY